MIALIYYLCFLLHTAFAVSGVSISEIEPIASNIEAEIKGLLRDELLHVSKDDFKLLLNMPAKYPNPSGFDVYRVLTRAGHTPETSFNWQIWEENFDELVLKLAYELLRNMASLDSRAFHEILGQISRILAVNKKKRSATLARDILIRSSDILQEPSATLVGSIQAMSRNHNIPQDIKTLLVTMKSKMEEKLDGREFQYRRLQFSEHS